MIQMDEFGQRMFVAEFAVSRKVFSALSKELQSGVCASDGMRDWGLLIRMFYRDIHGLGRIAHSHSGIQSTHYYKLTICYHGAQALVRVVPLLFSQVSEGPRPPFPPESSKPLQRLCPSDVHYHHANISNISNIARALSSPLSPNER